MPSPNAISAVPNLSGELVAMAWYSIAAPASISVAARTKDRSSRTTSFTQPKDDPYSSNTETLHRLDGGGLRRRSRRPEATAQLREATALMATPRYPPYPRGTLSIRGRVTGPPRQKGRRKKNRLPRQAWETPGRAPTKAEVQTKSPEAECSGALYQIGAHPY